MADNGIRCCFRPDGRHRGAVAVHVEEDGEREAGKTIVAVIGRGGDECDPIGNLTKLTDDQPFACLWKQIGREMRDPVGRRGMGTGVGIIANLKLRVIVYRAEEHSAFVMRAIGQDHWIGFVGRWEIAWGKWGHDINPVVNVCGQSKIRE